MSHLDNGFRSLNLKRFPETDDVNPLQAWEAADEYLLQQLDGTEISGPVLILNDAFGALACALALALDKAMTELPERVERVRSLNARLRTELANYPKVRINSPENAVPQILNLSVKDVKGTVFQRELDAHGVCVSVKSACSSDGLPSRAVFAVSRDRRNALSSWRISLSHRTTDEEITGFLQAFDACYRTLTQP